MAWRMATPCSAPGCPRASVVHGRCAAHQPAPRRDRRGSAATRGYGHSWRKVRDAYLARFPYCKECGELATDVDHIVARAVGGTDDESNLESLCHRDHSRKTAARNRGFGNRGRA